MNYDPKKVTVIINGKVMTGFRDGDIYVYEELDDRFTPYEGADGEVDYSKRPSNAAQITIGFKQGSESLKYIHQLINDEDPIRILVLNNNENGEKITGENGVILRRPNSNSGKEISEREVVIHLPDHEYEAL